MMAARRGTDYIVPSHRRTTATEHVVMAHEQIGRSNNGCGPRVTGCAFARRPVPGSTDPKFGRYGLVHSLNSTGTCRRHSGRTGRQPAAPATVAATAVPSTSTSAAAATADTHAH